MIKLIKTLANYESPEQAFYIINQTIPTMFNKFPDARNFNRTIAKLKNYMQVNSYNIKLWNDYKSGLDKKSEEYGELASKLKFTASEQRLLRNVMALLIKTRNEYSMYLGSPSTDIIGGYKHFVARINQAIEISNNTIRGRIL